MKIFKKKRLLITKMYCSQCIVRWCRNTYSSPTYIRRTQSTLIKYLVLPMSTLPNSMIKLTNLISPSMVYFVRIIAIVPSSFSCKLIMFSPLITPLPAMLRVMQFVPNKSNRSTSMSPLISLILLRRETQILDTIKLTTIARL